jgi:hypothetical protein
METMLHQTQADSTQRLTITFKSEVLCRFPRRESEYSLRVVPLELHFRLRMSDACICSLSVLYRFPNISDPLRARADFRPALPCDERDCDRVVRCVNCESHSISSSSCSLFLLPLFSFPQSFALALAFSKRFHVSHRSSRRSLSAC